MNAPSNYNSVTTRRIAIQPMKQPVIEDVAPSRVADFWEDAGDCIYDDDEDDVWECLDDEFQDWLDDELSSSDDYNDFIDELEDRDHRLGISTDDDDDYDDDLGRCRTRGRFKKRR